MLKKAKAEMQDKAAADSAAELAQGVFDSSRQIWLAGLGAFARAQQEGMKLFETLVAQGERLESRTRKVAVDTAAAARDAATTKAKEMQAMAGGTWDKLEQVFEDRVARALSKLGVYTQNDVERLAQRVDALSEAVNELIKASGGATRPRATRAAKTRGAKKAAAAKRTATVEEPAAPTARKTRTRARKSPEAT